MADITRSPTPTILGVVISGVVIVSLAMLGAFWQLADPRKSIEDLRRDLRDNYLTIREHAEFKSRTDREVQDLMMQIQSHVRSNSIDYLTRFEFDRWVRERDALITRMTSDIKRLQDSKTDVSTTLEADKQLTARIDQLYRLLLPPPPSFKQ